MLGVVQLLMQQQQQRLSSGKEGVAPEGHIPGLFVSGLELAASSLLLSRLYPLLAYPFMISVLTLQQAKFSSALAKEGAEFLPEVRGGEGDTTLPATHVERGRSYSISYF